MDRRMHLGRRRRQLARRKQPRRPYFELLEDRHLLAAAHPFELAGLPPPAGDGSAGVVFHAIGAPDYVGQSVDSAGDFNGDGWDDVIIGAMGAYRSGAPGHVGEAYLLFGKSTGFDPQIDLGTLDGTNGLLIQAPLDPNSSNGAEFGRSVAGLGDINGDGYSDVVIGAPNVDTPGGTDAGASYVLFGHANDGKTSVDVSLLDGTNGFMIAADHPGEFSGMTVSSAGDFNGDGYRDIAIKAPGAADEDGHAMGKVYLVFGKASGFQPTFRLSDANLDGTKAMVITNAPGGERSNATIALAGDLNGDRYDDLILGGQGDDPFGRSNAGAADVIFGSESNLGVNTLTFLVTGPRGFSIAGAAAGDQVGVSVGGNGDIDGDGRSDLMIGAAGVPQAYVIYSGGLETTTVPQGNGVEIRYLDLDLNVLAGGDGSRGSVISGMDPPDAFFQSLGSDRHYTPIVTSAGDANADGLDDLLIGAPFDSPGDRGQFQDDYLAGQSFVIFGQEGGLGSSFALSSLDGNNGFSLDGFDDFGLSGTSVASARDVNGDGLSDLLIGAPNTNEGANESGNAAAGDAYLVFGDDWTGAVTGQGTAGNDILNGENFSDDVLVGGPGDDVLRGVGLFGDAADDRDVLLGGEGNDRLVVPGNNFRRVAGGSGHDTLQIGQDCILVIQVQPKAVRNEACPGIDLDLTTLPDRRLTGIEEIDLTPEGIDVLQLDARSVLSLSDTTNTLVVRGTAYDRVVRDDGWNANGMELVGSEPFNVFTKGAATLKIAAAMVDSDEDGLPDPWEMPDDLDIDGDGQIDLRAGIDLDQDGDLPGDGTVELKLADLGATPDHKDLFVEIDAMGARRPTAVTTLHYNQLVGEQLATGTSLDEVVYAFFTAPVTNPDGAPGIRLHLDRDETTPVVKWGVGGKDPWEDFMAYKSQHFGHTTDSDAVKDAKRLAYRYAVFADQYWDSARGAWDSSGKAEIRGNDLFVTLGDWSTPGGTVAQQQGTFMHEFGHTLGLRHGGDSDSNYKPNYHSVMNYHWQVPNQNSGWTLDYSREDIADLNESDLDETAGIGFPSGSSHASHMVRLGPTSNQFVSEVGPVDWSNVSESGSGDDADNDGTVDNDTHVARDVNQDGRFEVLRGHNDWDHVALAVRGSSNFIDGVPANEVGDMPFAIHEQLSHLVLLGGPLDDVLIGGPESEVLIGGDGNDTLIDTGGEDILRGEAGDDTMVTPDGRFGRLDGGPGEDLLRLEGAGIQLDLPAIADRDLRNLEAIDIRGVGPNVLTLDLEEVLNLSETTDTLIVWADPDDLVVREPGWDDVGRDVIDGELFTVYGAGPATLEISGAVPIPGDLNIDGRVDFDDIAALIEALNDPQGYEATRGLPPAVHGDMDQDGDVDFDDIDGFVAALNTPENAQAATAASAAEAPADRLPPGPWDPTASLIDERPPEVAKSVGRPARTRAPAPERPRDIPLRRRPAVRPPRLALSSAGHTASAKPAAPAVDAVMARTIDFVRLGPKATLPLIGSRG